MNPVALLLIISAYGTFCWWLGTLAVSCHP